MKMKVLPKVLTITIVSLLITAVISCSKSQKQGAVNFKNDDQKALYSMGIMFGGRLADLKLNEEELNFIIQGIRDSAQGKKPEVDIKQFQTKVRDLFSDRLKKNADGNKQEGVSYIEKFVKDEGGIKAPAGFAYKILSEGAGKNPTANDTVEVHYRGTLINGTEFDSSYERNEKVTFPLNRVIKGWTEGLQLVKEGGKIKLVIPSDLAYGDHGAPPKIPGGATLIFEIELFKIASEKDKKEGVVGAASDTANTANAANAANTTTNKHAPTPSKKKAAGQ